MDKAVDVADKCALAFGIHGNGGGECGDSDKIAKMVEIRFPNFRLKIATCGDKVAIAGPVEADNAATMGVDFFDFGAAIHFPHAHRAVLGR